MAALLAAAAEGLAGIEIPSDSMSSSFAALARRESEMEEARDASVRLRAQLHLLAKSARQRDEQRVAELKHQNAEFDALREEAKDVESQLEVVFEAVTSLEAQILKERTIRTSELEALEAEFHDSLQEYRAAAAAKAGRKTLPAEVTALREVLLETERRARQTSEDLEASEKDSQRMSTLLQEALRTREGFMQRLRSESRAELSEGDADGASAKSLLSEVQWYAEEREVEQELRAVRSEASELRSALASEKASSSRGGPSRSEPPGDKQVYELEASTMGLRIEVGVLSAEVEHLSNQVEDSAARVAAAKVREELFRGEAEKLAALQEREDALIREERLSALERVQASSIMAQDGASRPQPDNATSSMTFRPDRDILWKSSPTRAGIDQRAPTVVEYFRGFTRVARSIEANSGPPVFGTTTISEEAGTASAEVELPLGTSQSAATPSFVHPAVSVEKSNVVVGTPPSLGDSLSASASLPSSPEIPAAQVNTTTLQPLSAYSSRTSSPPPAAMLASPTTSIRIVASSPPRYILSAK